MNFSVVAPLWQDQPADENLQVAIHADKLGFEEFWIGEMATYDAFALATAVGLQTAQIGLTVGPLSVSVRTPMTMAMGAASVFNLSGRQTNLAVGASSNVVVEEWHGRSRDRTATHLAETSQILRTLLAGDKAKFNGELATCDGYRLRLAPVPGPLTIAAFSPAAVRAAARHADRMLLNLVTPEGAAMLKQQLEVAAKKANRPTPKLAAWIVAAINPDRESMNQLLRAIVGYLAAPGYSQMFMAAGFSDLVEYARTRPHPKELLAAIPDELIAAIGLVGSETAIEKQLGDFRLAGVDEICLVPATAGDRAGSRTLNAMSQYL